MLVVELAIVLLALWLGARLGSIGFAGGLGGRRRCFAG
ncbi:Anaerobic C4-dicarboxylate transporter DcuA|nr:Anaerobic C4-dicarboxylate transporter DcuA [Candidatus Pantoea persica]